MNYSELALAGQHFGSSFYKLGKASVSLVCLPYPASMMVLQAGIGYGAFAVADIWSNTTCHNIMLGNNDAKFTAAALSFLGYTYSAPAAPKYLSGSVAGALSYAFSNYSPLCYMVGSLSLVNPAHVISTCKTTFNIAENLVGSASDALSGLYHLGKGLSTSDTKLQKSLDDHNLFSATSIHADGQDQDNRKSNYSHNTNLSGVFTNYEDHLENNDKDDYDSYQRSEFDDWQGLDLDEERKSLGDVDMYNRLI
jgi:hypothetical protein